ncbi:MAG: hypothetical protein ACRC0L_07380 [Angustibacter sp.]
MKLTDRPAPASTRVAPRAAPIDDPGETRGTSGPGASRRTPRQPRRTDVPSQVEPVVAESVLAESADTPADAAQGGPGPGAMRSGRQARPTNGQLTEAQIEAEITQTMTGHVLAGFRITDEHRQIARRIITGERTADQIVAEIIASSPPSVRG